MFEKTMLKMQKLAQREEQIMQAFWDLGKAFIRDIIPLLPDPKPHYNSVATMVKILEEKGFLQHEVVGNMNSYAPLVKREDYQKQAMNEFVAKYFNHSYSRMLAFFAREQKMTEEEVNEILKLIKSKK